MNETEKASERRIEEHRVRVRKVVENLIAADLALGREPTEQLLRLLREYSPPN